MAPDVHDPVQLAALWARLQAVVDEAATVLVRTAFSSIVRESRDFTVLLTDTDGLTYIQTKQGVGALGPAIGTTVRAVLEVYPLESWHAGDVIITNDPWTVGGHAGDVATVSPMFFEGRCLGFIAVAAHVPDIGGRLAPSDAREVYEEGLLLPPTPLLTEGNVRAEIVRLIKMNVRVPDQVMGDIFAQVSCAQLCERRLGQLMREYGISELAPISGEILRRSAEAMRRIITSLPDGIYTAQVETDGFDEKLVIATQLRVDGGTLHVDFEGTSPQAPVGINSVLNYTRAYSSYTLKCLLDPHGPANDGVRQAIEINAPRGSLLNAVFPAPVYARSQSGHYLGSVLPAALAVAAPGRMIAACGSPSNRTVFNGVRADGTTYSHLLFTSGGFGARSSKDGLACTPFPSNTGGAPIEVFERETDLVMLEKSLTPDSGGRGTYRGGLGMKLRIKNVSAKPVRLSVRMDRMASGAEGLLGGQDGGCAALELNGEPGVLSPKGPGTLAPDDVMTIVTPGGGGFGPPEKRPAEAVAADLIAGYITREQA